MTYGFAALRLRPPHHSSYRRVARARGTLAASLRPFYNGLHRNSLEREKKGKCVRIRTETGRSVRTKEAAERNDRKEERKRLEFLPTLIQPASKSWTVTRSHPSTFGIMVETVAAARVRAQNSYLARPQTSIPRFPTTGPCIRRQSRTCQHQMSSQLSLHNHARGRSQLRCTSPTTRRNDSHMSRHLNDSSHLSPAREL